MVDQMVEKNQMEKSKSKRRIAHGQRQLWVDLAITLRKSTTGEETSSTEKKTRVSLYTSYMRVNSKFVKRFSLRKKLKISLITHNIYSTKLQTIHLLKWTSQKQKFLFQNHKRLRIKLNNLTFKLSSWV